MIEIHGILEPTFKASVFYVLLQTHINFWKENGIDAYHQKAAAHFDDPAIPGKEAAQLFEYDSDSVASNHVYFALELATLALK